MKSRLTSYQSKTVSPRREILGLEKAHRLCRYVRSRCGMSWLQAPQRRASAPAEAIQQPSL